MFRPAPFLLETPPTIPGRRFLFGDGWLYYEVKPQGGPTMPETTWNPIYGPLIIAGVTIIAVVVTILLSNRNISNQTHHSIGGLQSDVQHLQQGQKDLSAQIDKRFDQQRKDIHEDNAKLLDQLGSHGHDTDGNTLFRRPV